MAKKKAKTKKKVLKARKAKRKTPRKIARKAARKVARKGARKVARKAARKAPQQPAASVAQSPSELISARIAELGDWRGEVLRHVRRLIQEADPGIVEEWKWGNPVWSCDGIICTGESYKGAVKLTFAKGAAVADPAALFNSSLEGNVRRAIDIHEGQAIDESAFKDLVRSAIAVNQSPTE